MPFHMVTSSSSLDQDGAVYQPIMMRLPDDLATVFGSRSPTSRRSRSDSSSNSVRSSFREVGVILQRLGSCSIEEIDEYLSSSSNDSYALTKIIDYGNFDDKHNFDNFDDNYYDDYTPRFFGVFMANNETDEQRREHEAAEERARQDADRARQDADRARLERERQAQEQARLQREQQERDQRAKAEEERR